MKNRCFTAFLGVGLAVGCAQPPAGIGTSSGSVALSKDESIVYAVDGDNNALEVVDARTHAKIAEVAVGAAPERVVVAADDTIFVSNRGSRSVSVIHRGTWAEAGQLSVGVEPIGLAVSEDSLFVVNSVARDSAEHGSLMAFDLKTLKQKWELAVGAEPHGVTLLAGNRALVTLYKQGDVALVDLAGPSVLRGGTNLYDQANASKGQFGGLLPQLAPSSFHPRGLSDLVASPDGQRFYAPLIWSREDPVALTSSDPTLTGGGTSTYGSGGPCNTGAVASPGLLTFDQNGAPMVDDLSSCSSASLASSFPRSALSSPASFSGSVAAMQVPVAVAVDPTSSWVFVVNHDSNNVAVMAAKPGSSNFMGSSGPTRGSSFGDGALANRLITVGAGPTGIAITRDGKKAFVYSSLDHTLSILGPDGNNGIQENERIALAQDTLSPDAAAGRRMFFGASDSRMTHSTIGISCGTCHLEGREDGHIWNFGSGPRQTPSLAGRMINQTPPFHWTGEFATLSDFLDHTVLLRMGGTGLGDTEHQQIAAYIDSLRAADSPGHGMALTSAQTRGAEVFHASGCDTCHSGAALTDNAFADVGTLVLGGPTPDDPSKAPNGFNIPSLLGVSRTPPYLHDGSAATLQAMITSARAKGDNKHGLTNALSDSQVSDLVEYLNAL